MCEGIVCFDYDGEEIPDYREESTYVDEDDSDGDVDDDYSAEDEF